MLHVCVKLVFAIWPLEGFFYVDFVMWSLQKQFLIHSWIVEVQVPGANQ